MVFWRREHRIAALFNWRMSGRRRFFDIVERLLGLSCFLEEEGMFILFWLGEERYERSRLLLLSSEIREIGERPRKNRESGVWYLDI